MAYNKNNRPSSKRHNYLIDKMTEANLRLHMANEELWDDNKRIVNDWKADREEHQTEIASLNRRISALLLQEEKLLP